MANERYEMTPLGVLTIDMPESMAKKAIDRLTLHMLRHKRKAEEAEAAALAHLTSRGWTCIPPKASS